MIQFVCLCLALLFFFLLLIGLDLYIPTVGTVGYEIMEFIAVFIYWATPFVGLILSFFALFASIKEWTHLLLELPIAFVGQIIFYITTMFGISQHFNVNNFVGMCIGWEVDMDLTKKVVCSSILNGYNLIMIGSVANMIILLVVGVASVLRYRNIKKSISNEYTKTDTVMQDIVLSDEEDSKEHV